MINEKLNVNKPNESKTNIVIMIGFCYWCAMSREKIN